MKTSYEQFVKTTHENFTGIHQKFMDEYKLDAFSNWYYDFATELLTFSNKADENELNFKFIFLGSFSEDTETWQWSWKSKDALPNDKTFAIKTLGEANEYKKLCHGYFDSDECDGWEFIAIAQHVLGGIGGYSVPTQNLRFFFLITEFVDNAIAQQIKNATTKAHENRVDCATHGSKRPAFVCHHLLNSLKNKNQLKLGFEESFETEQGMELDEDDDLSAWCGECESYRLAHDGWDEASEKFADIKLICESCYFELKVTHF